MGHGRTCLSALALSLFVFGTALRSHEAIAESPAAQSPPHFVALTTSQNLLATDPKVIARFLETARPAPVSAEDKARALRTLPLEGEVTDSSASARHKLATLTKVLRATGRESVNEIKVIDVPQAAFALHARAVILISQAALTLVDADELQALLAHEIGHEYVWTERERAFQLADHNALKDLELVCDAIAIVTLHGLGMDVTRLMTGLQKMGRFNRQRFGSAQNEKNYPTVAERRAFAGAVAVWMSARTTAALLLAGSGGGAIVAPRALEHRLAERLPHRRVPPCRAIAEQRDRTGRRRSPGTQGDAGVGLSCRERGRGRLQRAADAERLA